MPLWPHLEFSASGTNRCGTSIWLEHPNKCSSLLDCSFREENWHKGTMAGTGMPVYLDALGQQPTLNIYTQLSLAFGTPAHDDDSQAVATTLTAGLQRLTSVFPWTAGKIVVEQSE